MAAISNSPADNFPSGVVPKDWLTKNLLGSARLISHPGCADICSATWIHRLNAVLGPELAKLGISALDASMLYQAKYRHLTQLVSKFVRSEHYGGIYYRSRWGNDIDNWAIFEPWNLDRDLASPIAPNDPDLVSAMRYHSLTNI